MKFEPEEPACACFSAFSKPRKGFVPIDAAVMDRIESMPRAKELRAEPAMAELSELRARFGAKLSDEEFLLRATMPAAQVDAMRAVPESARLYSPEGQPALSLIKKLCAAKDLSHALIEKPGFKLELRRDAR